ncbi:MAG: hypothetical protein JNM25_17425 [Planctomycetes bacterium]|nr:hypothetical protein [Planctomycetota bacterium]
MQAHERIDAACRSMAAFAGRAGISTPAGRERRYLWTDAYAVGNLLTLHRVTGAPAHLERAKVLVDLVHEVLGRHRADDVRRGWISGLDDAEGRLHPTAGGLRIGKPLPERRPDEVFDERLEWDRDGQYFHYLTRWMHALADLATATGDARFLRWAVELARSAHAGFTYTRADGRRSMRWKMSIDLARPLVASMGHHDPLDGLLTLLRLRAQQRADPAAGDASTLDAAIADLHAMAAGLDPTTHDLLGLGGLLVGLHGLAQLLARGEGVDRHLFTSLLRSVVVGLAGCDVGRTLRQPAAQRLAFRELGLAIGLQATTATQRLCAADPDRFGAAAFVQGHLAALAAHVPIARSILQFWLDPQQQASPSWQAHLDIDEVMLATALLGPAGLAVGA